MPPLSAPGEDILTEAEIDWERRLGGEGKKGRGTGVKGERFDEQIETKEIGLETKLFRRRIKFLINKPLC